MRLIRRVTQRFLLKSELNEHYISPCDICIKVCPVGEMGFMGIFILLILIKKISVAETGVKP